MDAKELFFGLELETTAPTSLYSEGLRIGPRHRGIQVPYLPAGWKAEHDCSIQAESGRTDCEIVSPILKGAEGLAQVAEVCKILESKGHAVNASAGCHIHVGWRNEWPSDALARLVTIAAYLEKGLYAITGTKNRERGRFCRGVRRYNDFKTAKGSLDYDRYHALNLTNLARGEKQTVEFRIFSGTTSAVKACGWISVCLGLVERALSSKRCPTWTPKPLTGGWKKNGEGASEAERLMGYLAWGDGYARIHGGKQYGWISNVVPQEAVKQEFRRLAAKYDAQA